MADMGDAVAIATALIRRLLDEAAAAPDVEACGLLLGAPDRIDAVRACANVAADPATRFEIDPIEVLRAHRAARAGGPRIAGWYHSHPSGSPQPSPRDAADAAPDGSLWLVIADGEARAWRAGPDGTLHGRFDPVPLVLT
jgi:proteasome lid subunit RPN8/RPN11